MRFKYFRKISGGYHYRTLRKQPLEQRGMEFCIEVSTAILDHHQPVTRVTGFEQGRQHNATRCDAKQNQGFNFLGAKQQSKIRSYKSTHAMFSYEDVIGSGPSTGWIIPAEP